MSRQVQIRRGSATAHTNFTGAIGEITMDTTNKTLRVHDGETPGGTVLAKKSEIPDLTNIDYVIESQLPTAENNYTWYRKYKSGWVEQGGVYDNHTRTVVLPVTMSNTSYVLVGISNSDQNRVLNLRDKTTSSFVSADWNSGGASGFSWFVIGMSA